MKKEREIWSDSSSSFTNFFNKQQMRMNLKMRKEYTTVKIPTELARRLDTVAKNLGYTSRAEIVNDAIRRFIELRNRDEEDIQRQSPLIPAR